jgi:hypothetical protein
MALSFVPLKRICSTLAKGVNYITQDPPSERLSMFKSIYVCAWAGAAVLGLSGSTLAADAPAAGAHAATPDIVGTYELIKRVLPDGKEVLPPAIAGLYTMTHGRRNFNVAWTGKDGKKGSLSIVATYTLTRGKYCQKVKFWLQNNEAKPGFSNDVPAAANECSPVTVEDGKVTFQEPAGGPMLTFDKDGLTATAAGAFVDYWQKLR